MSAALQDLERLIRRLDEEIAAIEEKAGPMPEFSVATFEVRSKWHRDYHGAFFDLAQTLITEERARINTTAPDGHTIRMAGIRSSSTSGWAGALRNWQRAARKKLEEAGR